MLRYCKHCGGYTYPNGHQDECGNCGHKYPENAKTLKDYGYKNSDFPIPIRIKDKTVPFTDERVGETIYYAHFMPPEIKKDGKWVIDKDEKHLKEHYAIINGQAIRNRENNSQRKSKYINGETYELTEEYAGNVRQRVRYTKAPYRIDTLNKKPVKKKPAKKKTVSKPKAKKKPVKKKTVRKVVKKKPVKKSGVKKKR